MQILPLIVNRSQLRVRTRLATLEDFRAYCRQRVKAAAAPSYEEHNATARPSLSGRFLRWARP